MNRSETKEKSHPEDGLMHLDDVEIVDFGEMDMSDATVIAGFTSIGMVSTIVANYLIDALDLKQIGALNSCLLYTSPSPRDRQKSRMPSSA